MERVVQPGEILAAYGNARKGYEYPLIKFVVISESDIFGKEKKKKKRKIYEGKKIQSFSELAVGDYVVHENHGLGVYKGIEKIEVDKEMCIRDRAQAQRNRNRYSFTYSPFAAGR